MRAAEELGIRSPLKEVQMSKSEIRQLSRALELSTWDKPSFACLASRFPYHTQVDAKSLEQVSQAEQYLRTLGFTQIRVRHHGQVARIEVLPEEFSKMIEKKATEAVVKRFKKLGYVYVALDLAGYRTGSMNEPL